MNGRKAKKFREMAKKLQKTEPKLQASNNVNKVVVQRIRDEKTQVVHERPIKYSTWTIVWCEGCARRIYQSLKKAYVRGLVK